MAPAPGITPTTKPMTEERSMTKRDSRRSKRVGQNETSFLYATSPELWRCAPWWKE